MSQPLVRYDAMCRAIAEAHNVDEVKDIRDKAMALETYARQAMNFEAEKQCIAIRIRAEREVGHRLKEIPKAKGTAGLGRPPLGGRSQRPPKEKTLADYGISKDQSSEWQRLADVPEEVFERELTTQHRPNAASIIFAHAPKVARVPQVAKDALWLWGRLMDFEDTDRDGGGGLLDTEPSAILETMTEALRADTLRLAPRVAKWLMAIKGRGEETSDDERSPETA